MSNNPRRLLCIVGSMDAGGAETYLMKIYRKIDRKKYQMDFYVTTQTKGFYDMEIYSMGGRIFHSIPKSHGFVKSFCNLQTIVKEENYKYVLRVSQHSLSALDLLAAKLGGAKVLAYRSSNSNTGGNRFNNFLHRMFGWLPMIIPNVKIAPSTEAAEFMFGKRSVINGKAIILNNAIEYRSFEFNRVNREKIRKEFNIEDEDFVVGHVGRFNLQKNHSFLIDIFSEILKKNNKSKLILVGKGELESEIKNKILKLGISDKVIFTGVRSDIPDVLMSMDVFVFPSLFEGMPNTVIEAQATGLPCIIADTISKEVIVTELVKVNSLNESADNWAKLILQMENLNEKNRHLINREFNYNGYDIQIVSNQFVDIIFKTQGK